MTTNIMKYQPINLGRRVVWGVFALVLIVAPLIFSAGASISLLSQMGTVMIFALSYNMLLGQTGMLSFGHAVYSGLGAFVAIHALNLAGDGQLPVPVTLIPLVGGLAGMFFGILSGYIITKKSGTTFAMITLGIVELVFACSLMFPAFFGGEGGVTSNRVVGEPFLGISYGPQIQVYYLVAFWLFISAIGMFAFTQTPLGRMANAVRDNPERVEFIGFNTHWVRYWAVIVSSFFAGIAGGLTAINFEIVSAENVSLIASGGVLLFTFIGGIGFFFGPMLGAIVGIFLTVMLSSYTKAWQLYLGLFFIVIVMYAPGGLASLIMMNLRVAKFGKYGRVWPSLWRVCVMAALALLGVIIAIEMLYHITLNIASGPIKQLFGFAIDTTAPTGWIVALLLLLLGGYGFLRTRLNFKKAWGEVNVEIQDAIRRAEA